MPWDERTHEGDFELRSWSNALQVLGQIWPAVERADNGARGRYLSARAFDEAQVGGERLYINVHMQLMSAREHLQALLALLEHHGAGPMAPWTMLRPVLLGAFHALWALDPEEGPERRRRGLRLEVISYSQRLKWLGEYVSSPGLSKLVAKEIAETKATVGKKYRDEADALGIDWGLAQQAVDVTGEIKKLRSITQLGGVGPAHYAATWRSLSGFSHGYGYALVANSNLSADIPIPGGSFVKAVIKEDAFEMQGLVSIYLLLEACRLFVGRSTGR